MRLAPKMALVFGLAGLLASPLFAQAQTVAQRLLAKRGVWFGQSGIRLMLQDASVQKELRLDRDQVNKANEAATKILEAHKADRDKLREITVPTERLEKAYTLGATMEKETLTAVTDILKPDQFKRLQQIQLQIAGLLAFNEARVQTALNLNDAQKAKIEGIKDDFEKERSGLLPRGRAVGGAPANRDDLAKFREKIQAAEKAAVDKIKDVLTDGQKKTWKDITGEPFPAVIK